MITTQSDASKACNQIAGLFSSMPYVQTTSPKVWKAQAGEAPAPNFARLVKESNNNVREALQRLETELLAI